MGPVPVTKFVLEYRCGAAPDSDRVPFSAGGECPRHQRAANIGFSAKNCQEGEAAPQGSPALTIAIASRSKPFVIGPAPPSGQASWVLSTIFTYWAWVTPIVARSRASPPAAVGSTGEMPLPGLE